MKVRYWRETTDTEFYEMWPEPDRNKLDHIRLLPGGAPLVAVDNSEEAILQWEDDEE